MGPMKAPRGSSGRSCAVFAILWLCCCIFQADGHVALTFPPARKYDLDFLDSSRTKPPCGMPRGTIRTSLLEGSKFNVTWHLGYPHKGGFQIQLLDFLERPVLDLTPTIQGSEFVANDATAQSFQVQLPTEFTCENCTLRLLRQALEWGPNYKFWSCADVDIKPKKRFRETCSDHGRNLVGRCKCDRLYSGGVCQYRDECVENSDCGDHGKCINIDATTYPKHQCYCQLGWFGPGCNKRSPVRTTDIDFALYTENKLSDTFRLYWRILKEHKEIEAVMVVNGTSYAALGWRPTSLTKTCKKFPQIGLKATVTSTKNDICRRRRQLESSKSKGKLLNPYTPRYDFSPMDCTDIVIGSAQGTASRIADYYTRDRSTPKMDNYWGGKNDLTAAMGFEKDGVTTILFRKKLEANEPSDHTIERELMHVIFAQGQEQGKYIHVPKTGVEYAEDSGKDFYRPDELKYHGHKSQRGVVSLNFFEEKRMVEPGASNDSSEITDCGGVWKVPRNCNPDNFTCEYSAKWEFIPRKDTIRFTITTNHTDTWTGVAFSNDKKMIQSDAILGWVDKTGRPFLMDTWIFEYTQPLVDSSQNIFNISGKIVDGVTILSFSRKRITNDREDLSFTDDHCLFMMFPVRGGAFNYINKKIRTHEVVPTVSTDRICIKSCGGDDGYDDFVTTTESPGIGYNVEVVTSFKDVIY